MTVDNGASFQVTLPRELIAEYCEILGDVGPLRFQENQAQLAGAPQPLVPGTVWSCLLLHGAHRLGWTQWDKVVIVYHRWTMADTPYTVQFDPDGGRIEVRDSRDRRCIAARLHRGDVGPAAPTGLSHSGGVEP